MKRLTVLVTVILLVMAIATPAFGTVWDMGWKYCGDNLVGIRSDSTGTTKHQVSNPYFYNTGLWYNGGTWHVRLSTTNHFDVFWVVRVDGGSLSDPQTYGYCTGIT